MTPTRLSLAALILALPLAAQGFVPQPHCAVDAVSGQFYAFDDPRGTDQVWPARYPNSMVMVDWRDPDMRLHGYIQHCDSDTTLRFSVAARHADTVRERLEAMLNSDIVYGFDDVRQEVRLQGGRARMVSSPGRCACEAVAEF